ncbi:MAG: topoisomerase C-terminal repeat-containing protein [Lactobacillaceae bacterium]
MVDNKKLIREYVNKNGKLERNMYFAVLTSLKLKERGTAASMSNSAAYGAHLMNGEDKIIPEKYNELVALSKNIWKLRGQVIEEEPSNDLRCPLCNGRVHIFSDHVVCDNNISTSTRSCKFFFNRTHSGHYFTKEEIHLLLEKKQTEVIYGLVKKDNSTFFSAFELNAEGKVSFVRKATK